MRVFNKSNRLFMLESGADKLLIAPRKLIEVPDKFMADITYRTAVTAGDIEELTGQKVDADLAQTIKDNDTDRASENTQHPDGLEEMEARRKAATVSGEVVTNETVAKPRGRKAK